MIGGFCSFFFKLFSDRFRFIEWMYGERIKSTLLILEYNKGPFSI